MNTKNIPPHNLVEWLEDFCNQLDCPEPEGKERMSRDAYYSRLGAWETQMAIMKKIRYAIDVEKMLRENKLKLYDEAVQFLYMELWNLLTDGDDPDFEEIEKKMKELGYNLTEEGLIEEGDDEDE